jgi:RNA polymerase sigma-70 factor (ECF subfamily)
MSAGTEEMRHRARAEQSEASFDVFYAREYRGVVTLAYVLCGNPNVAEDLAQDAFVVAHRRWTEISEFDKPAAWIRRVVAYTASSFTRRKRAEARALLRLSSRRQQQMTFLAADHIEFWAAIRSLPKRQAQAAALHFLEDWPITDIATALGCAEGTVKVHLHRARAALIDRLGLAKEEGSI